MPSEKIQSRPGFPGQEEQETPCVRVGWGVEYGDVQVGSLFDRAHGAEVVLGIVNEWLAAAGVPLVPGREELVRLIGENAAPESIPAQFGVGFEGFHTTLSHRGDVNRLIALLRRARDGAFGRDE